MLVPVKNIKRKFKTCICFVAFSFVFATGFLNFSKTSIALETVIPAIPSFYHGDGLGLGVGGLCVVGLPGVPGVFTADITTLATATGLGVISAESQISLAIAKKTLEVNTSLSTSIVGHIDAITDFFMELWLKMLRTYFRHMTSNFAVLEANQERMIGSLIDTAEQNRSLRNIGKYESEANRAMRPSDSLKVVATVIGGLERAKNIQKGYILTSSDSLLNRTAANQYAKSITGTGTDEDFSGGGLANFASRWEKYTQKYCDSTTNSGYSGCTVDGLLKGLDVNVSDAVFSRETIEFADADIAEAVNELVINFSEPFIPTPLPAGLHSSVDGRMAILETEAYKSKRQVVLDAINHIVSRRLSGSQMGKYMENLRGDAGIKVSTLSNLAPYNPSYNEIMHYMTSERFRTGKYALEQVDEPENNLREKVVQNAFFLMQLNDMNDLLDKQAMIVTSRVSENVKKYVFLDDSGIESFSTGGK